MLSVTIYLNTITKEIHYFPFLRSYKLLNEVGKWIYAYYSAELERQHIQTEL